MRLAQPIETKRWSWLRGVDLNHRPLGYEPNRIKDRNAFQRLDAAGNDIKSLERLQSTAIGPQSDHTPACLVQRAERSLFRAAYYRLIRLIFQQPNFAEWHQFCDHSVTSADVRLNVG